MGGVDSRLDAERWREHLATVAGRRPGLVPVIKGNGYGFGLARLAEEAAHARSATPSRWACPAEVAAGPAGTSPATW